MFSSTWPLFIDQSEEFINEPLLFDTSKYFERLGNSFQDGLCYCMEEGTLVKLAY